jgi:hypothetical protein
MSTARDEAVLKVDEPGFKGSLARLILHRDHDRRRRRAALLNCCGSPGCLGSSIIFRLTKCCEPPPGSTDRSLRVTASPAPR